MAWLKSYPSLSHLTLFCDSLAGLANFVCLCTGIPTDLKTNCVQPFHSFTLSITQRQIARVSTSKWSV